MGNKFKIYPITLVVATFLFVLGIFGWVSSPQVSQASELAQEGWFPTATYTPTPTDEPTSTPTSTPTDEPTSTPTSTPTDGPTPTPTSTPTDGPTPTPTSTPTDGPTPTPTSTPTDGPTATPTPTNTPTTDPNSGTIVEVVGPSEVAEGDTFVIEVVASNMPDPGIFGFQFQLNWDDAVFSLVDGTAALNSEFSVVAKFDIGAAEIESAASREGAVADLAGPLTLLSAEFQANTVTDPDAASLSLSGVKLGRKGGVDVPVDQVINLDVVVVTATDGDIEGNVKVEGRADDNQAGHKIFGSPGDLTVIVLDATTDSNGDFSGNVPFNTYNIIAVSPGFLTAACENVVHNSSLTILAEVTLLAGDINNDSVIDITDATAIGMAFGGPGTDLGEDLNIDGVVDILDLILMTANHGETRDGNPWVCQP